MLDLNPWFWITLIGTPQLWLAVAAVLVAAYFLVVRKSRRMNFRAFAFVFVVSLLLVFGAVQAIKSVTQVQRICGDENPYCEDSFSFPSGHSASAFVFFTPLVIFLRRRWLPLLVIPLLIAYSRIALGVHTPADVVAGSLLGIAIPLVVWKVLSKKGRI